MSSSDIKQFVTSCVMILIIILSLGITYSLSNSSNLDRAQGITDQTGSQQWASTSQRIKDHIHLAKGSKLVVGNTGLSFRGLEKKSALIDLYLLDLDDEEYFTKEIDRKDRKKIIQFGDYTYRLVKANNNYVKLKLLGNTFTR